MEPTQIRFESTRLRKSPVVYDPTTSLARFERVTTYLTHHVDL